MTPDENEALERIADVCEKAALGDLEARALELPEDGPLRRIGLAVNHLLDISDAYVRESGAAMDHVARGLFHRPILTRGMHGAYVQAADTVNRAACSMRDASREIARYDAERRRTVEELGGATATVAAACEELTVTTHELKGQMGRSVEMSRGAVAESERSTEALRTLDEAARRIQTVVSLIARIASQTNLLALNATIEAARAGEYGAGFAVVANEVKVLSRDTARATDEITDTVEAMRRASEQATRAVDAICAAVRGLNAQASDTFHLLDEQALATAEIAKRITTVAEQTQELSHR